MPTPVITHTQLGWAYQTEFVNRVKRPSSFLTTLAFGGREEYLPTESVELSFRDGERLLAPFVEVNAEAIPVGARSTTFATVSTPNIRIKRPMEAYNVFLRRQPGTGMFINSGAPVAAARAQAIAEDSLFMIDLIDNRLEWMTSQLLTGMTDGFMELSYSVLDRANWRLRIPRSAEMDITLGAGVGWDDATPDIQGDFHSIKRLFSKHVNAPPTHCVMGSTAATWFMRNEKVKADLDRRNLSAGAMTLVNQFTDQGAIYLGNLYGIECWEYAREYVNDVGSAAAFMPTERVVFLATGALQDSRVMYGAIPDHGAFDAGLFVGKRFSKSWQEQDPSIWIQLLQSRPLPFIRQPNAVAVMDVVTA